MSLANALTDYRMAIAEANSFIALAYQQNATGNYILPQNQREFISGSAFLKTFIVWETFLESCVTNFMMGVPSIMGNIINSHINPTGVAHAQQLIRGNQKYFDWADPARVKGLCYMFFGLPNHICPLLNSIDSELTDLKVIRNASAHMTTTTTVPLNAVAQRLLANPTINSITVPQLIFAIDPGSPTGETIFTSFMQKLDIVAERIANA